MPYRWGLAVNHRCFLPNSTLIFVGISISKSTLGRPEIRDFAVPDVFGDCSQHRISEISAMVKLKAGVLFSKALQIYPSTKFTQWLSAE